MMSMTFSEKKRSFLNLEVERKMGIYVTFYRIVASIVILIFSMPFAAFAQQNPARIETETPAVEDVNAVRLAAKAAAEQDASGDINKLLWFGAGVGVCCIGGVIGGLTGAFVGNYIAPAEDEGLGSLAPLLGLRGWGGSWMSRRCRGRCFNSIYNEEKTL